MLIHMQIQPIMHPKAKTKVPIRKTAGSAAKPEIIRQMSRMPDRVELDVCLCRKYNPMANRRKGKLYT